MNSHHLSLLRSLAWVAATGLSWLYAASGKSLLPRFDLWFWGVIFWLNVAALGTSVTQLVLRR